ncbi:MAG: ribbon-helix-helix protein, CopG family [Sulfurospirillaceae bacterium]|nr:ribbon-helix-helix protein, CopG family [Sulfurospirillaceae bacterium]
MTHINVKIDEGIHFALEELARINKISKSDVVRDALQQYVNGMITDHLAVMDKRLENIEKRIEKELNRYNSLLAKNTLYSVATRYQVKAFHSVVRDKDEATKAEEAAWRKAVEITQKHYSDAGFKVESSKENKEVKND